MFLVNQNGRQDWRHRLMWVEFVVVLILAFRIFLRVLFLAMRSSGAQSKVNFIHFIGRIVIEGDFDLHTRAASKYDDRRVLHLPALKVR